MAEVLEEFPGSNRPVMSDRYRELFDGQVWKVSPTEYDYEPEDMKAFIASLKNAAHKQGCYIRTAITLDNHVILQRRPADYVPRNVPANKARKPKPPTVAAATEEQTS